MSYLIGVEIENPTCIGEDVWVPKLASFCEERQIVRALKYANPCDAL